jgi:hypothetical protein
MIVYSGHKLSDSSQVEKKREPSLVVRTLFLL